MASFTASDDMFNTYTLYNSKPFRGSFEIRDFLEKMLIAKISADLDSVKREMEGNGDRTALLTRLTSEEAFSTWYTEIQGQAHLLLQQK